ncbi:MAG TPA: DUF4760 domain-containing protein [Beijerinckiaceae bacterium]|nr:DUF4760 domain-containing protein [Beijerinckiaceae bacterium]
MNSFPAIVGLIGVAIAVWGVYTQRAIARRRATFDHISRSTDDPTFVAAHWKLIELAKEAGGLAPWASEENEKTSEVQSIRMVLNDFELVSIGIQRGIIDYEFYKRWYRGGVLRHWNYARPFVATLRTRTNNETLYHEFEQLAGWFSENRPPPRNKWFMLGFRSDDEG